jgi:hypothetical protein
MEPDEVEVLDETRGWHRYITQQTTVLPTRVYFLGGTREDRSMAELVIEVKASSLEPEPLRYPPRKTSEDTRSVEELAQAYFPDRRTVAMTEEELAAKLDEVVFVPFRLVVNRD